ncbi:unnamed protein product, partial [Discosporangium mesarthrocarpum]
VDERNRNGDTPFLCASDHGHTAILGLLANSHGADPSATNAQGQGALHKACHNGHEGTALELLQSHGLDSNRQDCLGRSALHLAAARGSASLVSLLVREGGNVDI